MSKMIRKQKLDIHSAENALMRMEMDLEDLMERIDMKKDAIKKQAELIADLKVKLEATEAVE